MSEQYKTALYKAKFLSVINIVLVASFMTSVGQFTIPMVYNMRIEFPKWHNNVGLCTQT